MAEGGVGVISGSKEQGQDQLIDPVSPTTPSALCHRQKPHQKNPHVGFTRFTCWNGLALEPAVERWRYSTGMGEPCVRDDVGCHAWFFAPL